MKPDIDEVIEILEAEKLYLERCIKDNADEFEYLHAHYHSKALFKINRQLQTLYKFKDPFYEKKCELERMIEIYKKWDNLEVAHYINSYFQNLIKDNEDKLKELNKQKTKPLYDDQKIDEALFNLLIGAYKSFVFYLNTKDNLGFNFELSELNILEISIGVTSVLKVNYFFNDDDDNWSPIKAFKGLGFELNSAGTKLIYNYNMKNFKDAVSIKVLLSRIIYDIFTFAEFESPASIIYFK